MSSSTSSSTPVSGATDAVLALRKSCDRCRSLKLKCAVDSEGLPADIDLRNSVSCQRCRTAKVPCVFSRRTRSSNAAVTAAASATSRRSDTTSSREENNADQDSHSVAAAPHHITGDGLRAVAAGSTPPNATLDCISMIDVDVDWHGLGHASSSAPDDMSLQDQHMAKAAPEQEPLLAPLLEPQLQQQPRTESELLPDLDLTSPLSSDHHHLQFSSDDYIRPAHSWTGSPGFGSCLELDFAMNYETMQDHRLLSTASTAGSISLPSSSYQEASTSNSCFSVHSELVEPHQCATISPLVLTNSLHAQLEELQTRSYPGIASVSIHAFHDYPIGRVLSLSHGFCALVSSSPSISPEQESFPIQLRETHAEAMPPLPPATASSDQSEIKSSASPSLISDTSTNLLLLHCFLTLTRIHIIVLGHFESYLQEQPDSGECTPQSLNLHLQPNLSLGELLPTNTLYSQIYTATQALLESRAMLHGALDSFYDTSANTELDPSNTDATTASSGMAKQELAISTSIKLGSSRLEAMAKEVKELLRDKMGLK